MIVITHDKTIRFCKQELDHRYCGLTLVRPQMSWCNKWIQYRPTVKYVILCFMSDRNKLYPQWKIYIKHQ